MSFTLYDRESSDLSSYRWLHRRGIITLGSDPDMDLYVPFSGDRRVELENRDRGLLCRVFKGGELEKEEILHGGNLVRIGSYYLAGGTESSVLASLKDSYLASPEAEGSAFAHFYRYRYRYAGIFLLSLLFHVGFIFFSYYLSMFESGDSRHTSVAVEVIDETEEEMKPPPDIAEPEVDVEEMDTEPEEVEEQETFSEREFRDTTSSRDAQSRDFSEQPSEEDFFDNPGLGLEGGNTRGGEGAEEVGNPFGPRSTPGRGSSGSDEDSILLALEWLAEHQDEEGYWHPSRYDTHCEGEKCRVHVESSRRLNDSVIGSTSLALLAFLGAGIEPGQSYPRGEHNYGNVANKALNWLLDQQMPSGAFGEPLSSAFMYNNAMAIAAVSEAYGMTGRPELLPAVDRATSFLIHAQNPGSGWRYRPRAGESDTSVTAWVVLALRSAQLTGIEIPEGVFSGANQHVASVTHPSTGVVGYRRKLGDLRDRWMANTPAGMFINLLHSDSTGTSINHQQLNLLVDHLPSWDQRNFLYWYYGTLALNQYAGPDSVEPRPDVWDTWLESLDQTLIPTQNREGHARGSWEPVGYWMSTGGRVPATALAAMTLGVRKRYSGSFTGRMTERVKQWQTEQSRRILQYATHLHSRGDTGEAVQLLETMTRHYSDSPHFAEAEEKLRNWD